ncbi:MAG: efflux RND transporter permease subunit [Francisellaceae bacterium]
MKWVKAFINHQSIVYLAALFVCIFGLYALFQNKIAPFPAISFNEITISIDYPGANTETVEKQVSREITTNLQSIDNIQRISTLTKAGSAYFKIMLQDGSEQAKMKTQMEIIQAISAANLPTSVHEPSITIAAGQSGLITYFISSKQHDLFYLQNLVQSTIEPYFKTLPGVVTNAGSSNPALQINLNPEKIAEFDLNLVAIASMININYASSPLGSLYISGSQYILNSDNNYNTAASIADMVVGFIGNTDHKVGRPIYLKDIATITFAPRLTATPPYASYQGQTSAYINLNTTSDANPFAVSKITHDYVNKLQKRFGDEILISPMFDMADIMKSSMVEVAFTIIIAAILVLLVALMFLGRLRVTLIPIITIPICLLGAAIFIYLAGISINILTLLAMVIAVGLVVDDAIVVVEYITHCIEKGMSKSQAIVDGTSAIASTIIGITLTLLAVYLPILFVDGDVITFIKPFAFTLAAAVFISGIVALTLTPVMAAHLISDRQSNKYQRGFNAFFDRVITGYQTTLQFMLRFSKSILLVFVILLILSGYFVLKLPQTVFPKDPSGLIIVKVDGSPQDDTNSIKAKLQRFSSFYDNPKVDYYAVQIDQDDTTNRLNGQLMFHVKDQWLKQNPQIVDDINRFIKSHHIDNSFAIMNQFSNWGGDYDISFFIFGGDKPIAEEAKNVTETLRKEKYFSIVNNDISPLKKQFVFDINTIKAERLGISRQTIMDLISTYYGGYTLNNNISIDGLSVPIIIKLNDDELKDPDSIHRILIDSDKTGKSYPLDAFVDLKLIAKPLMIQSLNNREAVEIDANLTKGYSLKDVLPVIDKTIANINPQLQHQYIGNVENYEKGNNQTMWVAIIGIMCIYFLLVVLFKNLIDPLIIMLTIPFSVIGGALSLYLIGGSINIYSIVGLITLVGLITKHGILIVQFANHKLKDGLGVKEAILTATALRFRPIMMTTLAMIFGALPLILSHELMYVARQNLGIVIIGGLVVGTLFSLFIVPMVYLLVKKLKYVKKEQ